MFSLLEFGSTHTWRWVPVMAALMLFAGGPVLAQTANDGAEADDGIDYTSFSLEDLMELDVVYGASKYEQKTTEAPSAVTIITAEDIKTYGYRNLAEVLNSVRSFHTTYDRNYHYAAVRGFGRPGDYNSRILVLVDGQRINDAVSDAASVGSEFPLDLALIQRIEIVRGPSSSLYGTSAFFGVINVITRDGWEFDGAQVNGGISSYGAYESGLAYGKKSDSGLELLIAGSHTDIGGQDLYYSEFDDPETNNGVFSEGDGDKYSRVFAKAAYGDFKMTGAFCWREKRIPTAPWYTLFNDSRTATWDNTGFLTASYAKQLNEATDVSARLGFSSYFYSGDWMYDFAEAEDDPVLPGMTKDYQRGQSVTGEVKLSRVLAGGHRIVAGTEYVANIRQDQGAYDVEPYYWSYLEDERDSGNWAAYALNEWRLLRGMTLNLGFRYDHHESFGGSANPRAGLIVQPAEGSAVKLLYGTAFRAPNFYEMYYGDGGVSQKPNPDLDPETITTYEIVWEQKLNQNIRGSVSAYRYDIEDLIEQYEDPADEILVFMNLAEVSTEGIELEVDGRLSGGIRGRASYSFQEARDKATESLLTNAPRHVAKLNIVLPVRRAQTFAGVEVQYLSARKTLAGNAITSNTLTNLTLYNQSLYSNVGVQATVRNLFDVKYGHPGAGEHVQDIIMQDGRSFQLRLMYSL